MPLTIKVPEQDFFDSRTGRFITVKETTLELEHSLLSISKWESKWHKPYLTKNEKTMDENYDYIRCMCLTKHVDPKVFRAIPAPVMKQIADYIADPMTGTTIKKQNQKQGREIITNELIYFWMTNYGIPFDPCEKWHLNRLMTLIEVAAIKSQPPKKMSKRDMLNQRNALNAQRRAKYNTRG